MDQQNKVYALPDFGFDKGGKLYITFFGLNFTGVKLFVLSPILRDILYRSSNKAFFCTTSLEYFLVEFHPHFQGSFLKNTYLNYSYYANDIYNESIIFEKQFRNGIRDINNLIELLSDDRQYINTGVGYIAINFTMPNVYLPIITNCDSHDKISAIIQYTNYNSFLDTREKSIQCFLTITIFLYLFLMLLWIINGLLYPSFNIMLHYLFTFSCLCKLLSLYISCFNWKEKQQKETVSLLVKYGEIVLHCFSFVVLMTTNLSASLGFSIYKSMDSLELFFLGLISLFFYLSIFVSQEDVYNLKVLGYVLVGVCFAVLMQLIKSGLDTASSFFRIFGDFVIRASMRNFFAKINLAISFSFTLMIVLLVYVIVFFLSQINSSRMLKIITSECAESVFFVVDLIFFAYRASYAPAASRSEGSEVRLADLNAVDDNEENDQPKELNSENSRFVVLDDPAKCEIEIISP